MYVIDFSLKEEQKRNERNHRL